MENLNLNLTQNKSKARQSTLTMTAVDGLSLEIPRPRLSSVSSNTSQTSQASFQSASGDGPLTPELEAQITIDELTKHLRTILEKARLIHEKAGVQKNVNRETKDGIKTITEAAEVALGKCERLRQLRTNATEMTGNNITKRKRDETETSPPQQPPKRQIVAAEKQTDENWTQVDRKNKKKKKKQRQSKTQTGQDNTAKEKVDKAVPKPRGTAVLIKPTEGKTYADLLRKVKTTVDPQTEKVSVRGYRKTKDGALLIQLQAGSEGSHSFQQSLQSAVGPEGQVRSMIPKIALVIMDLDCVTTATEVEEAGIIPHTAAPS